MVLKNNLELAIINCGFLTSYLSCEYFFTEKRYLDKLVKNKILRKNNSLLFGKVTSIYNFSESSIRKLRQEGIYLYKHDVNQIEHDYILLKFFLSLPLNEQQTWQNETALKQKLGSNIITSDGAFIKNNQIVGVEIFTPYYTKDKKNQKIQFLKKYCDQYITFNTKDFERR